MTDNVNHPLHYESSCSIECIEVMELLLTEDQFRGFCLGNAIKYLWRHKYKGGKEDLEKAGWYIATAKDRGFRRSADSELADQLESLIVMYGEMSE